MGEREREEGEGQTEFNEARKVKFHFIGITNGRETNKSSQLSLRYGRFSRTLTLDLQKVNGVKRKRRQWKRTL